MNGSKQLVDVAALLDQYDACGLECDGFTRVAHTVLTREGVAHRVWLGSITHQKTGQQASPHYWIELADGCKVDYRAQMWLGSNGVPHGVFSDCKNVKYEGHPVEMEVLNPVLFTVLTM